MNTQFNFRLVVRVIGALLLVESIILLLVSLVPILYTEGDAFYFIVSAIISFIIGIILFGLGHHHADKIGKREGSIIVTFTWIFFSLIGLLPYWLSNSIPSFTNAFFETISGFTTTGASILNNIEELSHGMLFWRSLTHWIGGIGIIVISLAIMPVFSTSGTQLFAAETSGPTKDKIHPKIHGTAKRLVLIYVILTFLETILLRFGGMGWFDAICHSFATIATGGFSTKQSSIAYWDSAYIQYIIILFMILSGINFSLYYFGFKKRFDKILKNEELRYFLLVLISFTLIITFSLFTFSTDTTWQVIEQAFRDALFTVSSLMTTTGFGTADYVLWAPFTWIILLIVMLTGASAGSTSGGIKMIRIVITIKACFYEFKRILHPQAIVPVRYNNLLVSESILNKVLGFLFLYLIVALAGSLILAATGMNFEESIGGMVSCLGGVGPGLGSVGPYGNYAAISDSSKWILSVAMLAGRLELFTFFLIFTPTFWKK